MRYRVNGPKVAADTLDGEVVAINFETGSYFSLTGSAARVWAAVERHATVDDVVEDLRRTYETDGVDLPHVVAGFLDQLAGEGLVVRLAGAGADGDGPADLAAASEAAEPGGQRPPFEAPVLEGFSDLSDLIRLDPVHEVEEGLGWPHAKREA
jgi:hypothetical protein